MAKWSHLIEGSYDIPKLPAMIKAWHCGSKPPGEPYKDEFIGSGEGYVRPPLGPGYYFHTNKRQAMEYCKYVHRKNKSRDKKRKVYLTQVSIDTRRMLPHSEEANATVKALMKKILPNEPAYGLMSGINVVLKKYGRKKAREVLANAGVAGFYEDVASGMEIAVYDLSVIKEISTEEISE